MRKSIFTHFYAALITFRFLHSSQESGFNISETITLLYADLSRV